MLDAAGFLLHEAEDPAAGLGSAAGVDLRQLEYFAAVARHRHFTRAAEELYVTQPALSQQVRRLERELGLELLTRTSAGVEVTPAGQELLARAEAILADVGRARGGDGRARRRVTRGFVRLATAPASCCGCRPSWPPSTPRTPACGSRCATAPRARCSTRCGAAPPTWRCWRSRTAPTSAGLEAEPLRDEPLRLIAAPDEALEGAVRLAELSAAR